MNAQSSYYKEPNSQRKVGWAPDYEKIFTPQTFSYFPHNYTIDEIEIWIRRHRIDDLQRRIAMQDFESNDQDIRSPSPEPVYDQKTGLRVNTREQRLKDRYIKERNKLITEVLELDSTYSAPPDYKPPKRSKKILIPDPDNPSLNYIGQIIGPGGQTQKKLETESKCRIQIRGRGSQNKSKIYNKDEADENEPLYVLVTANNQEDLEKGSAMVEAILQQTDENKKYSLVVYDHLTSKKVWCEICGEQGHKFFECPEKLLTGGSRNYCLLCGSKNHAAADCPEKKKKKVVEVEEVPIEEEFHNFMKELKVEKECKEKYKAITGKEPPRDFNYLQFQAEQDALKGGNLLSIQAETTLTLDQPKPEPVQQPSVINTYSQNQIQAPPRPQYQQPHPLHQYGHFQQPYYQHYPNYYQAPQSAMQQSSHPNTQTSNKVSQPETHQKQLISQDQYMVKEENKSENKNGDGVKKPDQLAQQLYNQQQYAYQQQQQTQIGAQSNFKPYQPTSQAPSNGQTVPQQAQIAHQYQYPQNYYGYNYNYPYYNQYYYPYGYQYGAYPYPQTGSQPTAQASQQQPVVNGQTSQEQK